MKGVQLDAAVCPGTVQSPDCRARDLHGRNARVKSYESNAPGEIKSRYELETPLSWEFVYVHGFHVELRFGKGWCGHASVLQEPEDPGFDAALRGDAGEVETCAGGVVQRICVFGCLVIRAVL